MSDTWTLGKQVEDIKEDIKDLQGIAHEPIFTREMVNELFNRIDKLEKKSSSCPCGSKKAKAKA